MAKNDVNELVERQYVVIWSILGPVVLLTSLFLLSLAFGLVAGHRSESASAMISGLLLYLAMYGMLAATPFLLYFGSVGLIKFSRVQIPQKRLTIALCVGACLLPFFAFGGLFWMNSRLLNSMH